MGSKKIPGDCQNQKVQIGRTVHSLTTSSCNIFFSWGQKSYRLHFSAGASCILLSLLPPVLLKKVLQFGKLKKITVTCSFVSPRHQSTKSVPALCVKFHVIVCGLPFRFRAT